jgi:Ca2+:H+ antiporter
LLRLQRWRAPAAGDRRVRRAQHRPPRIRRALGIRPALTLRPILIGATFALAALAGALHYATDQAVATFVVAGLALAGLAWTVGLGTESVGSRFGPAVTGVLQSTLGNLPELFIVVFALRAGETVVAQTSILGSLFANALLVLGLAIVAGSFRAAGGTMRFAKRLPNDTATLLLMAVFIIVVLGVSDSVGDRASRHQVTISAVGAVALLSVYAVWVIGYLRADVRSETSLEESTHATLPFRPALALLAGAGILAALVSDWFVQALDPAVTRLGISKAFTGIVIVAIAGNAVENIVGITLAWKGKSDLAVSIVKNSVSQIACFLFPTLVLISLLFENHLTFVVGGVYIAALAGMAIAVWQITGDGEAVAFEGLALVALYVILATIVWFE